MVTRRILSIFIAFFLLFTSAAFSEESEEIFEVHFLSVGVNDGILLRFGDECAFIDSGNYPEGLKCAEYMKNIGVTRLKYYIASHGHLDHVGGAPAIVTTIPTDGLIFTYDVALYAMQHAARNNIELNALNELKQFPTSDGDVYTLGNVTITCVGPESYSRPPRSYDDEAENNNSLLLYIEYGDISFFLTGDSPAFQIKRMNEKHPEVLKSTVIKMPHHRGTFDYDIYQLVEADSIVFSTGSSWVPLNDQMTMAFQSSKNVFITADNRHGNIVFSTDGKTLSVETQFAYDYSIEWPSYPTS